MNFFDTHTHPYLEEFDNDRPTAMQRCIDAGVTKMIVPNVDLTTIGPLQQLCTAYPTNCFPAMALHPSSVDEQYTTKMLQIETLLNEQHFYAIGETGIDLYWDKTFEKEQKICFEQHIEWAYQKNLPIIIHCRKSFEEVMSSLQRFGKPLPAGGIFHCFPCGIQEAKTVIKHGFHLGIGGVVTFKNALMAKVVEAVPLEHLVIETDSPYLTPEPFRGKRNESSFIIYIAQKIADLQQTTLENVAAVTYENARKLFKIDL
ncbi:MAG: TatD family hydrolase [Bacteroidales bacterium]|nr:TatD family hydrolase [Bacteroidales bacterium]